MQYILLLLTILFSLNSIAQSSVYKITGKGTTMYLGGTIHILQESDFPLPKEYEEAYLKSSLVIFETKMDESSQSELSELMMELATYSKGKSLKTELNKETYKKLALAFEDAGMSIKMFENSKPIMAILTLTVMKLQKLGYNADGVDKFFESKAEEDDISIGSLEKAAFQIKLLAEAGEKNSNDFVEYSLRDIDKMETEFEKMKKAWRTGDADAMAKTNADMLRDFPEMHKTLLVQRNNNWMKKINVLMETSETEYILVGALHLYGKGGLLELLEAEGYTIEQL